MIKDYELLQNIKLLCSKRLIIWGAGVNGKKLAKKLVEWTSQLEFVDSDKNKQGHYQGLSVYAPEQITQYDQKDIAIVLAVGDIKLQESIMRQITVMGYENIDIYTSFAIEGAICFLQNSSSKNVEVESNSALIKKIEMQDYIINKISAQLKLVREMLFAQMSEKSVYVYQSKKVGSVSLVNSVQAVGIYGVHVHNLLSNPNEELFLRDTIKRTSGKVISIVREPVARQISLLWHYWGRREEAFLREYQSLKDIEGTFYSIPNKEDEFDWYKNEFQKVLNINIYDYPFDRNIGYSIIEKDGISILLLKLEKLNVLEKVIGDFLEVADFKILNGNMARCREYHYAYQNYLDHVKIPLSFWKYYYHGNQYMDHFYSEDEKRQFYKRWASHIKE